MVAITEINAEYSTNWNGRRCNIHNLMFVLEGIIASLEL